MASAKAQAGRHNAKDSPEMLISFLQYALDDVRALSQRSGRHLEEAISTLAEDTSLMGLGTAVDNLSPRS
jgi:hypothetical protein